MSYHLKLEIPWLPPINSARDAHWRVRHTAKRKALSFVQALSVGKRPQKPLPFANVMFTRCSSYQADYGNIVESFKGVLDALVTVGILEDDSPKHLKDEYRWEKAKRKHGCIRIEVDA